MSETLDEIERVFMAFGDKTRLHLLYLMKDGEVSVNFLCESLGISQPKVSRHLAYLRSMEIVHPRRDGKWIYYSLNEPRSRMGSKLLEDTLAWVGSTPELGSTPDSGFRRRPVRSVARSTENYAANTCANTHMYEEPEMDIYLL